MGRVNWLKVVIFILQMVASGMSRGSAVSAASAKFGVGAREIWKHGGF